MLTDLRLAVLLQRQSHYIGFCQKFNDLMQKNASIKVLTLARLDHTNQTKNRLILRKVPVNFYSLRL